MSSQAFGTKRPAKIHLLQPSGGVGAELLRLWSAVEAAFSSTEQRSRTYHESIVTATFHNAFTGTAPTPDNFGLLTVLKFTLNNDAAWRQFKIPSYFVDTAAFHLHWTKSSDANENGKAVRWRISYKVFNGGSGDAAGAPTGVLEYEDTYKDSGTTTRIMNRTPDLPAAGFVPGYYMCLKVEAITPVGTPLASAPALFSVDVSYNQRINL